MWAAYFLVKQAMQRADLQKSALAGRPSMIGGAKPLAGGSGAAGGAPPTPTVPPKPPSPPVTYPGVGVPPQEYLARMQRLQQQGITPQAKPNQDYIKNLQPSPEAVGNIGVNQALKAQLMPPGQ